MRFHANEITPQKMKKPTAEAFEKLEQSIDIALENYSNVHRGSGHNSMVSTHLFEKAREIVLEYLGLNKDQYTVIFCTPRRAALISEKLKNKSYVFLSSQDIGLPLGVRALAVKKKALPGGTPFETGGGNARLVSPGWVIWAGAPDKFEAGTPAIVNIIAFARALQLIRQFGKDAFRNNSADIQSAHEILYHDELAGNTGPELLEELRRTLIGRSLLVPTAEGTKSYINFDYAASTPTFTPVWNVVRQTWRQSDQIRKEFIHEVRSICAGVLGAPLTEYDVIFTSNATEAINLAAESTGRESRHDVESVVLNTILEHNSNELPWRMIPNFSLIRMNVDDEGFLDLKELESILRAYNIEDIHGKKRIKLVTVSGASNVLGVFNDLAGISLIVHQYGARLLVDAAQLVAHRKVETESCGIDYLAFSAHKVYAPFGTGVLVARKGFLHFSPDELEKIQSSGEENAGGVAALGKSLLLLQRAGFDVIREDEQALTARALRGMARIEGLKIYGIKSPDSPRFSQKGGVIIFSLKNILPDKIARALADRGGIGVRYGCHCAHMLIKRILHVPKVLEQFQGLLLNLFPRLNLPGVIRVSMGIGTSPSDVDTLLRVLGTYSGQSKPKKAFEQQMKAYTRDAAKRVYS